MRWGPCIGHKTKLTIDHFTVVAKERSGSLAELQWSFSLALIVELNPMVTQSVEKKQATSAHYQFWSSFSLLFIILNYKIASDWPSFFENSHQLVNTLVWRSCLPIVSKNTCWLQSFSCWQPGVVVFQKVIPLIKLFQLASGLQNSCIMK